MSTLPQKALLDVLVHCHKDLVVFMRNNFEDIVVFLRQKDIIDHKKYREVQNMVSQDSSDDKARKLVLSLENKVEEDDRYFYIFVQLLNQDYSDSKIASQFKSAMRIHNVEDKQLQQSSHPASDPDLESLDMMDKFRKILFNLMSYLKSNTDIVLQLAWLEDTLVQKPSIFDCKKHCTVVKTDSLSNIMLLISEHSSFFNYELVKDVFESLNYEEGKKQIEDYEKHFHCYLEKRVSTFPPNGVGVLNSRSQRVSIELDISFQKCRLVYLRRLRQDISKIFKVEVVQLLVDAVQFSSIHIIFHIARELADTIFPLSGRQISELKMLEYESAKIFGVTFDEWEYKLSGQCTEVPDGKTLTGFYSQISMAVCGSTGADRNSICNSIIGEEILKHSDEILTVRNSVDRFSGIHIEVASIEAFDDTKHDIVDYKQALKDLGNKTFDLFLYCIAAQEEKPSLYKSKRSFNELEQLLHPKVWNNCIVVLTYADSIVNNRLIKSNSMQVTKKMISDYDQAIDTWTNAIREQFGSYFNVIPAGSSQCFSILDDQESWLSNLFHAIINSGNEEVKECLIRYNRFRLITKQQFDMKAVNRRPGYEHPIIMRENSTDIKEKLKMLYTPFVGVMEAVGGSKGSLSRQGSHDDPYNQKCRDYQESIPHEQIHPHLVKNIMDLVQHSRNCQIPGCTCKIFKSMPAYLETCKPPDSKSKEGSSDATSCSSESEPDIPHLKKQGMYLTLSKDPDKYLHPHSYQSSCGSYRSGDSESMKSVGSYSSGYESGGSFSMSKLRSEKHGYSESMKSFGSYGSGYESGGSFGMSKSRSEKKIPISVKYLLDHAQDSRNCQLPVAEFQPHRTSDYKDNRATETSSSTKSDSDFLEFKKQAMHLHLSKEPDEHLYPHNHLSTNSYKIHSGQTRPPRKRRSRSMVDLTPITEMRETPAPAKGVLIVSETPVLYTPKSPQILKQMSISTDDIPVLCLNDCVAKLTTPSPTEHSIYSYHSKSTLGSSADNVNSESLKSKTTQSSRSSLPFETETEIGNDGSVILTTEC